MESGRSNSGWPWFDSRAPTARVSEPAEDAGSNPVCLQVQILPWHPRTDGRVAQRQCSRMISGRREVRPLPRPRTSRAERCSITSRYVSGHGPKSSASHLLGTSPRQGALFKPGTVGVRISGRARHSPDARADERSFSKREAAGSNPAGASKRPKQLGYLKTNPDAFTRPPSPGYPNQQRTPAQTRCVAGANPVPGTNVTSRTCSVTNINGEVAGSNPAGRKPVAQWQSANTPSAKTMFVSLPRRGRDGDSLPRDASRVRIPPLHDVNRFARTPGVLRRRRAGSEPVARRFESVPRVHSSAIFHTARPPLPPKPRGHRFPPGRHGDATFVVAPPPSSLGMTEPTVDGYR